MAQQTDSGGGRPTPAGPISKSDWIKSNTIANAWPAATKARQTWEAEHGSGSSATSVKAGPGALGKASTARAHVATTRQVAEESSSSSSDRAAREAERRADEAAAAARIQITPRPGAFSPSTQGWNREAIPNLQEYYNWERQQPWNRSHEAQQRIGDAQAKNQWEFENQRRFGQPASPPPTSARPAVTLADLMPDLTAQAPAYSQQQPLNLAAQVELNPRPIGPLTPAEAAARQPAKPFGWGDVFRAVAGDNLGVQATLQQMEEGAAADTPGTVSGPMEILGAVGQAFELPMAYAWGTRIEKQDDGSYQIAGWPADTAARPTSPIGKALADRVFPADAPAGSYITLGQLLTAPAIAGVRDYLGQGIGGLANITDPDQAQRIAAQPFAAWSKAPENLGQLWREYIAVNQRAATLEAGQPGLQGYGGMAARATLFSPPPRGTQVLGLLEDREVNAGRWQADAVAAFDEYMALRQQAAAVVEDGSLTHQERATVEADLLDRSAAKLLAANELYLRAAAAAGLTAFDMQQMSIDPLSDFMGSVVADPLNFLPMGPLDDAARLGFEVVGGNVADLARKLGWLKPAAGVGDEVAAAMGKAARGMAQPAATVDELAALTELAKANAALTGAGLRTVRTKNPIIALFGHTPAAKVSFDADWVFRTANQLFRGVDNADDALKLATAWADTPDLLVRGVPGLTSKQLRTLAAVGDDGETAVNRWGLGLVANEQILKRQEVIDLATGEVKRWVQQQVDDLTAQAQAAARQQGLPPAAVKQIIIDPADVPINPIELTLKYDQEATRAARRLYGLDQYKLPQGAVKVELTPVEHGQQGLRLLDADGKQVATLGPWDAATAVTHVKNLQDAMRVGLGARVWQAIALPFEIQRHIMSDMWLALRPANWFRQAGSEYAATFTDGTATFRPVANILSDFAKKLTTPADMRVAEAVIAKRPVRHWTRGFWPHHNPYAAIAERTTDFWAGYTHLLGARTNIPFGEQAHYLRALDRGFNRTFGATWKELTRATMPAALQQMGIDEGTGRALVQLAQELGITGSKQDLVTGLRQAANARTVPVTLQELGIPEELFTLDERASLTRALNEWQTSANPMAQARQFQEYLASLVNDASGRDLTMLRASPPQPGIYDYTKQEITDDGIDLIDRLINEAQQAGVPLDQASREAREFARAQLQGELDAWEQFVTVFNTGVDNPAAVNVTFDLLARVHQRKMDARRVVDEASKRALADYTPAQWAEKWRATQAEYERLSSDIRDLLVQASDDVRTVAAGGEVPRRVDWWEVTKRYLDYDEADLQKAREVAPSLTSPRNQADREKWERVIAAHRAYVDSSYVQLYEAFRRYPNVEALDVLREVQRQIDVEGAKAAAYLAELRATTLAPLMNEIESLTAAGQRVPRDLARKIGEAKQSYYRARELAWANSFDNQVIYNQVGARVIVANGLGQDLATKLRWRDDFSGADYLLLGPATDNRLRQQLAATITDLFGDGSTTGKAVDGVVPFDYRPPAAGPVRARRGLAWDAGQQPPVATGELLKTLVEAGVLKQDGERLVLAVADAGEAQRLAGEAAKTGWLAKNLTTGQVDNLRASTYQGKRVQQWVPVEVINDYYRLTEQFDQIVEQTAAQVAQAAPIAPPVREPVLQAQVDLQAARTEMTALQAGAPTRTTPQALLDQVQAAELARRQQLAAQRTYYARLWAQMQGNDAARTEIAAMQEAITEETALWGQLIQTADELRAELAAIHVADLPELDFTPPAPAAATDEIAAAMQEAAQPGAQYGDIRYADAGNRLIFDNRDTYANLPDEMKARIKGLYVWRKAKGRQPGGWIARGADAEARLQLLADLGARDTNAARSLAAGATLPEDAARLTRPTPPPELAPELPLEAAPAPEPPPARVEPPAVARALTPDEEAAVMAQAMDLEAQRAAGQVDPAEYERQVVELGQQLEATEAAATVEKYTSIDDLERAITEIVRAQGYTPEDLRLLAAHGAAGAEKWNTRWGELDAAIKERGMTAFPADISEAASSVRSMMQTKTGLWAIPTAPAEIEPGALTTYRPPAGVPAVNVPWRRPDGTYTLYDKKQNVYHAPRPYKTAEEAIAAADRVNLRAFEMQVAGWDSAIRMANEYRAGLKKASEAGYAQQLIDYYRAGALGKLPNAPAAIAKAKADIIQREIARHARGLLHEEDLGTPAAMDALGRVLHPGVELAPPPVELAPAPVELAPPSVELAPPSVELAPAPVELAPPSVELAPPSVELAPAPRGIIGKRTQAWTDPTKPYDFEYEVVDLRDLIASNLPEGRVNPQYPAELQPRDRTQAASRLQVNDIARNLAPQELLADTNAIDRGAPIVGPDNVVESGNGRVLALQLTDPTRQAAYRAALQRAAADLGLDPAAFADVANPVLVRRRVSDVDRVAFVNEANARTTLAMNAAETGAALAPRLTVGMFATFDPGAAKTLREALDMSRNQETVRRVLAAVPTNERAGLVDAQGALTQAGTDYIRAGLFARIFGSDPAARRLIARYILDPNPDLRSLGNAIERSAGNLVRLEMENPPYAAGRDLAAGLQLLEEARRGGRTIAEQLAQGGLFETPDPTAVAWAQLLEKNLGKTDNLTAGLLRYTDLAAEHRAGQPGLLGDLAPANKADLVTQAARFAEVGGQERLFELEVPAPVNLPDLPDRYNLRQLYDWLIGDWGKQKTPEVGDVALHNVRTLADAERRIREAMPGLLEPRPNTLTPHQRAAFNRFVDQTLAPRFDDVTAGSLRSGQKVAQEGLLNYADRRGFDMALALVFPYHYYWTRGGWTWAKRLARKPAVLNAAFDAERTINAENRQSDVVPRLRGTILLPNGQRIASPLQWLLPWNIWRPDPYMDPEAASSEAEKWWLRFQSYTPGVYPAWDLAVAAYFDQTDPLPNGESRVAAFTTRRFIPLAGIASDWSFATMGAPFPTWAGGSPGDPYRIRMQLASMAQAGKLGADPYLAQYAQQISLNAANGVDPMTHIPPAWQKRAQAAYLQGAKAAGGDRLLTTATSYVMGNAMFNAPQGEHELWTANRQYGQSGYSPDNPMGSHLARQDVLAQTPMLPAWWSRNEPSPGERQPGQSATYSQFMDARNAIYDQMHEAANAALLANPNISAKALADIRDPYYAQLDALDAQYKGADLGESQRQAFKAPSGANVEEQAVFLVERLLYVEGKPAWPVGPNGGDPTKAQIKEYYAARDKWLKAAEKEILLRFERLEDEVRYQGLDADYVKRALDLVDGKDVDDLTREYVTLKYATPAEKAYERQRAEQKSKGYASGGYTYRRYSRRRYSRRRYASRRGYSRRSYGGGGYGRGGYTPKTYPPRVDAEYMDPGLWRTSGQNRPQDWKKGAPSGIDDWRPRQLRPAEW